MHLKIILFVIILTCLNTVKAEEIALMAVASNMMHVMNEIHKLYSSEVNHNEINMVYGSSGNFTRQIIQGAPFELFLSANRSYVDILMENGAEVTGYAEYTRGRIGYYIPKASRLSENTTLEEINRSLVNGDYDRISIANPEFAPYGIAADQALQTAGLWAIESDKLLLGENTAQAVQFVVTGGADIGIIPSSYAVMKRISDRGDFYLIPEAWHEPIIEYLVLLKRAGPTAKDFYNYLLSEKPKPILEKYGYTVNK